jgi:hypothetical protein
MFALTDGVGNRAACRRYCQTVPVPSAILSALSEELRRLEAVAARTADPDDDEVERLVCPVREELEHRALKHGVTDRSLVGTPLSGRPFGWISLRRQSRVPQPAASPESVRRR